MRSRWPREKISDPKFLRYVQRMFKSGVLAAGELTVGQEGVPQGSLCSPVLANIFAHNVIDVWLEDVVKSHCAGRVAWFRSIRSIKAIFPDNQVQ